jgi:hypothetical protein
MAKQLSVSSTQALTLAALLTSVAVSAQSPPTDQSWLDQPLTSWNKDASGFPQLPEPTTVTNLEQCLESVRQPENDAERALFRRGWQLFGAVQSFGLTQLIMATSGFDGMCRPIGYQAFIYAEGRYAGTLSPLLMNSRTDGALINVRLLDATKISAEFVRYDTTDPLCCPSKTSFVSYSLRIDEISDLIAINARTQANCPANERED